MKHQKKSLIRCFKFHVSSFMFQEKGFTLIELLVVIAVSGILSASVLIGYRVAGRGSDLKTDTFKITDVLNLARQRTVSALGSSSYGVHFEASQSVLFKGVVYSASDPDNIFYTLSPAVEIADITLAGGGSDVVFDRITGKTAQSGSIKARLIADTARFNIINILSSGQSDISTGALAPSGTRLADSRHTHFNYAQDVRSAAVTLTLNFPGYLSQDVNFQDYLDAGKTVFDWSGTILVNGSNQILRIHTHSLDASSANFSITRDLRYNNIALQVSLDGQNLINYAADGTVTQGTSLWAGVPVMQ